VVEQELGGGLTSGEVGFWGNLLQGEIRLLTGDVALEFFFLNFGTFFYLFLITVGSAFTEQGTPDRFFPYPPPRS
jgi:hypothetical protein